MKTIILSVCWLLTYNILGQQILDTNTIWSETNKKFYYIDNDTTVLNGYTYKNVHSYSGTDLHYSGAEQTFLVREDNERVFWRNEFTNEDYLLYDFGLTAGDSIYVTPNSIYTWDSVLLICQGIDTMSLFGIERRRLTMRTANPSPYYDSDIEYWLDSIGSTLGLFNSGHLSTAVVDQVDPNLYCCHKGFNQVYQDEGSSLCHGSQASLENGSPVILKVYPNPLHSKETLFINAAGHFKIIDLQGKTRQTGMIEENQIQLKNYESEIYILQFEQNGKIYQQKITLF